MVVGAVPTALAGGGGRSLDATLQVFHEGFESSGLAPNWTFGDDNAASGADTWGISSYRSAAGAASAWVAQSGSRIESEVVFFEDFESGSNPSGWTIDDEDSGYGYDYWGPSTVRANGSSTYSMWCAQVGYNDYYYGGAYTNAEVETYDSYQQAYLTRSVSLSTYTTVVFSFWVWYQTESSWDYFRPVYYDGDWVDLEPKKSSSQYFPGLDGSSGGWIQLSYNIPSSATDVGFLWSSDSSVMYEGAYVDDVMVVGYSQAPNANRHTYDDSMDAWMTRTVSLSDFESAEMEFSYWIDSEQDHDILAAKYRANGTWVTLGEYSGSTNGWVTQTFTLPTNTSAIRFEFTADAATILEGAYIDEIFVRGSVSPPTCGGQLSATTGTERSTVLYFDGIGGGGWGALNWTWDFGDGTSSGQRSPSHVYMDPGTYTPRLTVTDSIGQQCLFEGPRVTIEYDLSEITVGPAVIDMVEGSAREFNAQTRFGHELTFTWRVSPLDCGDFNVVQGSRATFTADVDAGDLRCTVVATYGTNSGSVGFDVLHDLSEVVVTPPSASVFASQRVVMSAADVYGHPFHVEWWATCGRVLPDQGDSTTFTAVANPGSTCVVTAEMGSARTTVPIQVLQDPTDFTVEPAQIFLSEGTGVSFDAKDRFDKPIEVDWSVTPATCGEFEITHGAQTSFTAGIEGIPVQCRVTATVSGETFNSTVLVFHDVSSGTLESSADTVVAGDTVEFAAFDKYHHALPWDWTVSPSTCGEFTDDNDYGFNETLVTNQSLGEVVCTVTAYYNGAGSLTLRALLSIELGPPSAIDVTFLGDAPEGTQMEARATVRDAGGHALDSTGVSWTTTCDSLSRTTGATTLVTAPANAAGSTCDVTASFGGVTGTGHLKVVRGPAARMEMSPSSISISNGERVEVSLKAWDQFDHEVQPSTVIWSVTCGHIEGEGTTVTFVAPDSGGPCQITASVPGGASVSQSAAVSPSLLMPIIIVVVIIAAIVGLGFMMRGRGKGGSPSSMAEPMAAPMEAPVDEPVEAVVDDAPE